ncbi:MAG: hypothetical protein H7Z38_22505 [Rubrivivax sp.]|nr:hypothetical protein [Pyrinomonadaceae bacterium]
MNTQKNGPVNEQLEQTEQSENALSVGGEKKIFVEPAVSVPVDVLEATALFQSPTVDTSATN